MFLKEVDGIDATQYLVSSIVNKGIIATVFFKMLTLSLFIVNKY